MSHNPDVSAYIAKQPDWQQASMKLFREAVHTACPTTDEAIKWGVPVFIFEGKNVLAMSCFKQHTKYNFFMIDKISLNNTQLFNNGLDSKAARSIDLFEGDAVDQNQLTGLLDEFFTQLKQL